MSGARALVLGDGFVGRAVGAAVRSLHRFDVVSTIEPAEMADLTRRTVAGAHLLIDLLSGSPDDLVVNCCGRLRGTDEEMIDANSRWPAWLCDVLAGWPTRLIHIGSAAEYGDPGGPLPLLEDTPPRPTGAYGETKWAGSSAILDARSNGLDAAVVRGFNLVAPALPEVSPLRQFRDDVTALPPGGGEITLWFPETVRDFIMLDDLARVVASLAILPDVPDIVNACSGVGVDFASIVMALATETDRDVAITSLEKPGIRVVIGDATRMRALTGVTADMDATLLARTILGLGSS